MYINRYINQFCVGCQKQVSQDKMSKPLKVSEENEDYWHKHASGKVRLGMWACNQCAKHYWSSKVSDGMGGLGGMIVLIYSRY